MKKLILAIALFTFSGVGTASAAYLTGGNNIELNENEDKKKKKKVKKKKKSKKKSCCATEGGKKECKTKSDKDS